MTSMADQKSQLAAFSLQLQSALAQRSFQDISSIEQRR